jgi:hypothetical protein
MAEGFVYNRQDFLRPCFVYIAECGEYAKVGMAINTEKRLNGLQTGCPYPIAIVARRQFPTEDVARGVEAMIHLALEPQAHRGEWFLTTPRHPTSLLLEHYDVACREYRYLPVVETLMQEPSLKPRKLSPELQRILVPEGERYE